MTTANHSSSKAQCRYPQTKKLVFFVIVAVVSAVFIKVAFAADPAPPQPADKLHYCAYKIERVTCHPSDGMCEIVFEDGSSRTIEGAVE